MIRTTQSHSLSLQAYKQAYKLQKSVQQVFATGCVSKRPRSDKTSNEILYRYPDMNLVFTRKDNCKTKLVQIIVHIK